MLKNQQSKNGQRQSCVTTNTKSYELGLSFSTSRFQSAIGNRSSELSSVQGSAPRARTKILERHMLKTFDTFRKTDNHKGPFIGNGKGYYRLLFPEIGPTVFYQQMGIKLKAGKQGVKKPHEQLLDGMMEEFRQVLSLIQGQTNPGLSAILLQEAGAAQSLLTRNAKTFRGSHYKRTSSWLDAIKDNFQTFRSANTPQTDIEYIEDYDNIFSMDEDLLMEDGGGGDNQQQITEAQNTQQQSPVKDEGTHSDGQDERGSKDHQKDQGKNSGDVPGSNQPGGKDPEVNEKEEAPSDAIEQFYHQYLNVNILTPSEHPAIKMGMSKLTIKVLPLLFEQKVKNFQVLGQLLSRTKHGHKTFLSVINSGRLAKGSRESSDYLLYQVTKLLLLKTIPYVTGQFQDTLLDELQKLPQIKRHGQLKTLISNQKWSLELFGDHDIDAILQEIEASELETDVLKCVLLWLEFTGKTKDSVPAGISSLLLMLGHIKDFDPLIESVDAEEVLQWPELFKNRFDKCTKAFKGRYRVWKDQPKEEKLVTIKEWKDLAEAFTQLENSDNFVEFLADDKTLWTKNLSNLVSQEDREQLNDMETVDEKLYSEMEALYDLEDFDVRRHQVELGIKIGSRKQDDPILMISQATSAGKSHTVMCYARGAALGMLPAAFDTGKMVVIAVPDATLARLYVNQLQKTYQVAATETFPPNTITSISVITHKTLKEKWNQTDSVQSFKDCVLLVDEGHALLHPLIAAEAVEGLRKINAAKPRVMVLFSGSWSSSFQQQLLPQLAGEVEFWSPKNTTTAECKVVHLPALIHKLKQPTNTQIWNSFEKGLVEAVKARHTSKQPEPVLIILDSTEDFTTKAQSLTKGLQTKLGIGAVIVDSEVTSNTDIARNISALNQALGVKKKQLGEPHSIIIANLGCMMAYNFWRRCFPIVALEEWETKLTQSNYIQIMGRSSRGGPSMPKTFGLYSEYEANETVIQSALTQEEYPAISKP